MSDGSVGRDGPATGGSASAVGALPGLTLIAVDQIEDALQRRREQLLTKQQDHHVHACVMTLIVSVQDERDNVEVFQTVEQLAGKYPLRVIGVQSTSSRSSDDLFAWINAECEGEPSAPICSEEIALQGGVDAVDRIASAVRGLLTPDLPVFLWWRGSTPHGDLLWHALRPMCDRVIVDSVRFGDGAAALDTLRRLAGAASRGMSLRDFNWERTAVWRKAVATCFDDRDVAALLPGLDRCAVTYAADGERDLPSARALLLAGWLTSRHGQLRGHARTAPGKRWQGVEHGRIVAVTLTSSTCKASVLLVRQASPSGVDAETHDSDGELLRRWHFPAQTLSEAELLDACLETLGSDPMLAAALEA